MTEINKEVMVDRIKADLKNHVWYADYPDEDITAMAENVYERELRRINKKIPEREITCSNYRNAQRRLKKEMTGFLGNR